MTVQGTRYEAITQSCLTAHGIMRPNVDRLTVAFGEAFRNQDSLLKTRPLFKELYDLASAGNKFAAMSPAASLYKTQMGKKLVRLRNAVHRYLTSEAGDPWTMHGHETAGIDTWNMFPIYHDLSKLVKAQKKFIRHEASCAADGTRFLMLSNKLVRGDVPCNLPKEVWRELCTTLYDIDRLEFSKCKSLAGAPPCVARALKNRQCVMFTSGSDNNYSIPFLLVGKYKRSTKYMALGVSSLVNVKTGREPVVFCVSSSSAHEMTAKYLYERSSGDNKIKCSPIVADTYPDQVKNRCRGHLSQQNVTMIGTPPRRVSTPLVLVPVTAEDVQASICKCKTYETHMRCTGELQCR